MGPLAPYMGLKILRKLAETDFKPHPDLHSSQPSGQTRRNKSNEIALDLELLAMPAKTLDETFEAIAEDAALLEGTKYKSLEELISKASKLDGLDQRFLNNANKFVYNTAEHIALRYLIIRFVLDQTKKNRTSAELVKLFKTMEAELRPEVIKFLEK